MPFSTNSDLPASVLQSVPDGLLANFRESLNQHLGAGCSETLAFIKAYRGLEDGGHVHKDGVWVAKDVLTQADVHVDAPLGGKPRRREKDDPDADPPDLAEFEEEGEELATETEKRFVPPAEVQAAAKAANASDGCLVDVDLAIMRSLAIGEGLDSASVRKIAAHFEAVPDEYELSRNAWGGPLAAKWANRVVKKLDAITKAGNGVMLAFWPDPELAKKLAVPGGEGPDQLHLTLAYFGKLDDIGMDSLPALEQAVQKFAATQPPLKVTLGGVGRFPATPQSDGQDVAYLGVHSPDIQKFREGLVSAVEAAGSTPKKDFGYTPHITLKMLPAHAPHLVSNPEPADVTFDKIVLSIGNARKEYPLTGQVAEKTDFEMTGRIVKVDAPQRLVFGWFSVVKIGDRMVTDLQQDQIDPATIEAAAYDFVLHSRVASDSHQTLGVGDLVESLVLTVEKAQAMQASLNDQGVDAVIKPGCQGWWGGFRVSQDVFDKIVAGDYKDFSIGGLAKRVAA